MCIFRSLRPNFFQTSETEEFMEPLITGELTGAIETSIATLTSRFGVKGA